MTKRKKYKRQARRYVDKLIRRLFLRGATIKEIQAALVFELDEATYAAEAYGNLLRTEILKDVASELGTAIADGNMTAQAATDRFAEVCDMPLKDLLDMSGDNDAT
jgi:GGDEF domain-containing protein